jgi:hypothetical protein
VRARVALRGGAGGRRVGEVHDLAPVEVGLDVSKRQQARPARRDDHHRTTAPRHRLLSKPETQRSGFAGLVVYNGV